MTQETIDQNLMIVAAVEGYARKHSVTAAEAFALFKRNDLFSLIRSCYESLHTQGIDESLAFAEDVLARNAT